LAVVLYGCETLCLALREEHKLRVFENRMLRRMFVPKWDEVTGGWRKLCNEKQHRFYSLPSIITIIKSRRMTWGGDIAGWGQKENAYRLRVGKPEGRRPLGRPRWGWVDNIKMDLVEIAMGELGWIEHVNE
jgi:hypothetical protein